MKMNRLFPLLALLLAGTLTTSAQSVDLQHVQAPLKVVLEDLAAQTGLQFSYSETVIGDISLSLEAVQMPLDEALALISQRTGLVLERVSHKQVIVHKRSQKLSICGLLVDASSGQPLPYASLVVDPGGQGTITDESGRFAMEGLEAEARVTLQYIGYLELTLAVGELSGTPCRTLAMVPDAQALEEVVVFAYLSPGVNKNADGSFTLVKDEMGLFPGMVEPDIFKSIQFAPGIGSLDESASGIQIRGGSPDQNLILFDGIKLYNTGHFFGMISALNPHIIESAKIFKGGASPEYGDRVSGVIDLSSGEGVPKELQGGFGLNGTHGDAFIKVPLGEHIGLLVSGRRSYSDLLKTPTFDALSEKVFQNTTLAADPSGQFPMDDDDDDDDDFTEILGRDDFLFQDANAKVILEATPRDLVMISGLYTNNELDFTVSDDEDLIADHYDITNKGAALSWEGSRGQHWAYVLRGYYSGFDSRYENALEEEEIEERLLRGNRVEDRGGTLQLGYRFNAQNELLLGYSYSRTEVDFHLRYDDSVGDNDDGDESRGYDVERGGLNQTQAVHMEYTLRFPEKGFLSLGGRASHYSVVNRSFVEPRANLELPMTKALRLKGSYEMRVQPISQLVEFEDTQLRLENNIWTLANGVEIPVLESDQYSGGFLWNEGGWTLDLDGYHKRIRGLTSFTNGFITAPTQLSKGESNILGVDLLVKRQWDLWDLWLGYSFNDVAFEFPELQAGTFPGNNDIDHSLKLATTFRDGPWQFSLGWHYRTGSPYTAIANFDPNGRQIEYGKINGERLPVYHRLDASALFRFAISKDGFRGEIGASMNNIYARSVPISIFYRMDTDPLSGETELNQIRQMSQGLTPNMVLRFHF